MCDIQVYKCNNQTYFAKNSDRHPREAQLVIRIPAVHSKKNSTLQTTHIQIPQTANRFGIVLSKPFWTWGAEMGANDQGIVIGNVAVFTKVHDKTPGLIGMDLVRLGLERGSSAQHALKIITEHLQKYGQGGACDYYNPNIGYDNSFIIADVKEIWLLETAYRHWVAKRISSCGAVSNYLTIGCDMDLKSKGIEDFAKSMGLWNGKNHFHFARTFRSRIMYWLSNANKRLATNYACLAKLSSRTFHLQSMMNNLRFHATNSGNADICRHATSYARNHQTCGSMVSCITADENSHFFTGTSAPCLSIFKPVNFDYNIAFSVLNADACTVRESLWKRHEQIHRRIIVNAEHTREWQQQRDTDEQRMLAQLTMKQSHPANNNFAIADEMVTNWESMWYEHFCQRPFRYSNWNSCHWYWKNMNRLDGIC